MACIECIVLSSLVRLLFSFKPIRKRQYEAEGRNVLVVSDSMLLSGS